MKHKITVTVLVSLIAVLAAGAASMGIFSKGGPGPYRYESIRGKMVTIYGEGLYRHMSAEVAPQGIAQDVVTLVVGIPLLLFSLLWARRESLKGRILLAGTLGYFLVTYLFYLVMGMYNALFLAYAALLGTSFFAFSLVMLGFNLRELPATFGESTPNKAAGGYLMFSSLSIALLWLNIVVPPLLDGSVIPDEAEHYTTLIVQGLDLGLLLPLGFVSGYLFYRETPMGYLLGPVYLGFLAVLMTALTAKVIAMGLSGYSIIPAVFIIPLFNLATILFLLIILKHNKN